MLYRYYNLNLKLFDRSAKYPKLTPAGEALLNDAGQTLQRADFFLSKAATLSEGVEHKVVLTMDDMVRVEDLKKILASFGEQFPFVELEILRSSLGDASHMVASGRADIGVMTPIDDPGGDANYRLVANVAFIPVVHADHQLADVKTVKATDLEPFRQIVETSRGGDREPQNYILSRYVWYVESLQVACDLIRQSLGWGAVPRRLIDTEIKAGNWSICPLKPPDRISVHLCILPGAESIAWARQRSGY